MASVCGRFCLVVFVWIPFTVAAEDGSPTSKFQSFEALSCEFEVTYVVFRPIFEDFHSTMRDAVIAVLVMALLFNWRNGLCSILVSRF